MTKALFGLSMDELAAVVKGLGQPGYRGGQIAEAIYRHRVTNLSEISTLPQGLREALCAEGYSVGLPEIIQTARSVDGTERYLMRMADGETVETVWMPDGDGGERGDGSQAAQEEEAEDALEGDPEAAMRYRRATICVSSQARSSACWGRTAPARRRSCASAPG